MSRNHYVSAKLRMAADALADVTHELRENGRPDMARGLSSATLLVRMVARCLDTGEEFMVDWPPSRSSS